MKKITLAAASIVAVSALGLTACASGASGGDGDKGSIILGAVDGWEDVVATSMLWQAVLEEEGYDVEIEYQDIAVNYVGLSQGDVDLYLSSPLPRTHGEYYEEYKDDIEVINAWNHDMLNVIAVNEDAPIDSLDELAEHADEFDNKIVGLEAGAGITQTMENEVIPAYGLEGMDFVTSSTAAMLTELKAKTDAGENVAVNLWQPHWAYKAFPIKNLEDPEGAFGEPEDLTTLGRTGFTEDFPEVTGWLESFEMDSDTLASLMDALTDASSNEEREKAVEEWMSENGDFVTGMTS